MLVSKVHPIRTNHARGRPVMPPTVPFVHVCKLTRRGKSDQSKKHFQALAASALDRRAACRLRSVGQFTSSSNAIRLLDRLDGEVQRRVAWLADCASLDNHLCKLEFGRPSFHLRRPPPPPVRRLARTPGATGPWGRGSRSPGRRAPRGRGPSRLPASQPPSQGPRQFFP